MAKDISSTSVWRKTKLPSFAAVSRSKRFDVVVVGGGITGLTAAYLLKRSGKKVAVVERKRLGIADTGQTTAHLTMVTDLRLKKLVKNFGKEPARLAWQAGGSAINTISEITRLLKVDCEFRQLPGYLHASLDSDRDESRQLSEEADLARDLGIDAQFVPSVPYFDQPGIRFPNQARFHPFKYLAALAKAIDGDGSAVYEESEVTEITADPFAAVANGKRLDCEYLVIATHVPLMGKSGFVSATLFQAKLAPYSTYAIGGTVPAGTVPEACYWDTTDPYYYTRINAGKKTDYVIFGGKDHKTGQDDTEARFFDLRSRLYELIPQIQVDCQWSGQVIETNDGLPYIGETAENQFVATGFAGNGMTFGTLGGMMACDAVLGRENPWSELFSVNRKKIRGGVWDFVKENLDYPYYFLRDHLTPAKAESPADLKNGQAEVLKVDGERVACHRDEKGKLTMVSAICTHMGCLVHWNQAEGTWDCPCHGSRFWPSGQVLAGPAETPLEPVEGKGNDAGEGKSTKPRPVTAEAKKPASKGGKSTPAAAKPAKKSPPAKSSKLVKQAAQRAKSTQAGRPAKTPTAGKKTPPRPGSDAGKTGRQSTSRRSR